MGRPIKQEVLRQRGEQLVQVHRKDPRHGSTLMRQVSCERMHIQVKPGLTPPLAFSSVGWKEREHSKGAAVSIDICLFHSVTVLLTSSLIKKNCVLHEILGQEF